MLCVVQVNLSFLNFNTRGGGGHCQGFLSIPLHPFSGSIEVISLTNLSGALLFWRVSRAFCACGTIFLSVVIGLFDLRLGFYVL